jgi:hypothetical protein
MDAEILILLVALVELVLDLSFYLGVAQRFHGKVLYFNLKIIQRQYLH